jgi:hypothetical protein
MDLRLDGASKKPRLLRLWAPITLKGPIRSPKPGLDTSKALQQGGVGVALSALLSPLAVLLPFVDPGLAKDADCAALMATARENGAPSSGTRR